LIIILLNTRIGKYLKLCWWQSASKMAFLEHESKVS